MKQKPLFPPTEVEVKNMMEFAKRLSMDWCKSGAMQQDLAVQQTYLVATVTACCYAMLYKLYYMSKNIDLEHIRFILDQQAVLYQHHLDNIHNEQTETAEKTFNGLPLIALQHVIPEEMKDCMQIAYSHVNVQLNMNKCENE